MRHAPIAVAFALLLSACRSDEPASATSSAATTAPANSQAKRTTPSATLELIDERALANWDGDPRYWSVENGVLVGRSSVQTPCDTTTYSIWRGGEVDDFEIELEYRITGGNSGLQFRSREVSAWQVAGLQADIEDGPNWSGCLYEQDGRGVVARRGERVQLESSGARKASFGESAQLDSAARKGAWNRYQVRAVGPRVELTLNGVRTVEVLDLDEQRFRPRGVLALQLHAGPPMTIEVRSLKLKRLEAAARTPERFFAAAPLGAREVSGPGPGATQPQWLWSGPQPRSSESVAFQRHFELPRAATHATLRATADNRLRVFVNGEPALQVDEWFRPREVDVTALVRNGENTVSALAWNEAGAAGAWIELVLESGAQRLLRLVTDASWSAHTVDGASFDTWRAVDFDSRRAGAPHVLGPVGIEPWRSMGPAMRGESAPTPSEESALAASELELPEGFVAELLYSVPKGEQGSWVVLCEDARGRFYVSDQYGALYRVTAPVIGSNDATKVERAPIELGSAHGLCWAFDSLYAVVAESKSHQPGLYRCRDTNGDDVLDQVEQLRAFEGSGEHGPHAVVLGPDQKLWIVGGNHTKLPEPIDASWMTRTWAEDLLLPRIDDPNGHAVGVMAPGGWIVRTDEDAQHWELWAAGFRNAYDIAFDERGELYTFDSDMEWDVGLPWYRPARVCHVPPGADFGWRHGSGKWPSYYVDSMPATCDIGLASPTGVAFATKSGFDGKYKRAFFAADWAYGKVFAVWGDQFETFLSGKPFPVTDLCFAGDGALYITTGGRRTQSGLYRIRWAPQSPPEQRASEIRGNFDFDAQDRVAIRKLLDPAAPAPTAAELGKQLARTRLSEASLASLRAAIERASAATIAELAESFGDRLHLATVLSCAVRAAPQATSAVVLRRIDELPLENVGEGYRLDTLRVMGLALLRLEVDGATRAKWRERLLELFPYSMERTDRELVQLLAHLNEPRAIAPALATLAKAKTEEDKLWIAYCLRALREGWTIEQRRQMLTFLDVEARTFQGGHSLTKYVQRIRADFVEGFSDAERSALANELDRPASTTVAAGAPAARFVRAWTREELAPLLREPLRDRDLERGRTAFAKARCAECHRFGGEGGATGPDLTGAGSRFSRSDLLDALLTPSATISDQYQDTEILTHEGDLFVGRVEGDTGDAVKLRRLPPQEDLLEFRRDEIAVRRPHPLSRMPSGLVDVLEQDELLDLVAYLLGQGARGN